MNGDTGNRDLWEAVNSLRTTAGRIEVSVAKIEATQAATKLPCEEHAEEIGCLRKEIGTLRDRVTSGLTMKAVLFSALSAAAGAILTVALIWNRVSVAVAAIAKGGQ
ncbi:MAG: hypothetical protein WC120_05425 [Parcubacteria group bacterium]|jgi:HAMP domain-containing protein